LAIHFGSEDRVCTTQAGEASRLVGKVYNLCRVLETGISTKLTVKSILGSSLSRRTLVTFMMMVNKVGYNSVFWYFLLEGVLLGNNWVYY
jgi:hypothetical protein